MKQRNILSLFLLIGMAIGCAKKVDLTTDNTTSKAIIQKDQTTAALTGTTVTVTTLTGSEPCANPDDLCWNEKLRSVSDIDMGPDGNLYVTDDWFSYDPAEQYNRKIRKFTLTGVITSLAFIRTDPH